MRGIRNPTPSGGGGTGSDDWKDTISSNEIPGTGANTLAIGETRIWNHIAVNKTYSVHRDQNGNYKLVEKTPQ